MTVLATVSHNLCGKECGNPHGFSPSQPSAWEPWRSVQDFPRPFHPSNRPGELCNRRPLPYSVGGVIHRSTPPSTTTVLYFYRKVQYCFPVERPDTEPSPEPR